jgi:hypothetical protein
LLRDVPCARTSADITLEARLVIRGLSGDDRLLDADWLERDADAPQRVEFPGRQGELWPGELGDMASSWSVAG